MKSNVDPKVAIAAVVLLVVVIGVVAYKMMFPNTTNSPNSPAAMKEYNDIHANSEINKRMQAEHTGRGAYSHPRQ